MQVKKPEIREAILKAAMRLFSAKGYIDTTQPQIAAAAGISTTNLYSYFDSKLAILYAVHGPWIQEQLSGLALEIRQIEQPRERMLHLLGTLFRDIPARKKGFANNIMQAIATVRPTDGYRPVLLAWLEENILAMVLDALPAERRADVDGVDIANHLIMAFNGYIVARHVSPSRRCSDATIEYLCDLMLSGPGAARARAAPAKSASRKRAAG
jgi:AcrR family transcriptional regulator